MPAVTRVGDTNTGHDLCPPVSLVSGSSNVFVDKIAVGRVGDSYSAHGCIIHIPHSGAIASGSSTVFVNGIPVGRIGDSVSCGGSVCFYIQHYHHQQMLNVKTDIRQHLLK